MSFALGPQRFVLSAALIVLGTACTGSAVEGNKPAGTSPAATVAHKESTAEARAAAPASPLDPEIAQARLRLATMEKQIKDYTCVMVKRERVGGKLLDYEMMFTKVRHSPFSVYMYFLSPTEKKGQQVVYIQGRNGGNLIAQPVGLAGRLGPYSLPPTGYFAMQGQRYPITNVGFVNLTRRLIEVGEHDRKYGECTVKHVADVKVNCGNGNTRVCTLTEVTHPVKRDYFHYYIARIYVDKALDIPIRFESYTWPETAGDKPVPLEEYTYMDVKLNNGLTDADFQIRK